MTTAPTVKWHRRLVCTSMIVAKGPDIGATERQEWPGYQSDSLPGIAITRPTPRSTWRPTHIASGMMLCQAPWRMSLSTIQALALEYLAGIDWTRDVDAIRADSAAVDAACALSRALC